MVDAAIVMIENAHKHIERSDGSRSRAQLIIDACREVGPALFFSLMIITVSFLPVFALGAQEGRLFKPLAFTKTFAMAGGALLRSEEHTSELQSLMRISYAVFCLKKKKKKN